MKLPTQKKILLEDLKGAPTWIRPLVDIMNTFMERVYLSLNKNISFPDNINAQIKELTYITPDSYPLNVAPVQFTSELKVKATGLWALQCYDTANYTPPPGPLYIPWVENNGNIIISTVKGLEPNKTYLLRLVII